MKIGALLAGIGLAVNALVDLINLAFNLTRMGSSYLPRYLAGQATWLFAQACMMAFFFMFYARAKE